VVHRLDRAVDNNMEPPLACCINIRCVAQPVLNYSYSIRYPTTKSCGKNTRSVTIKPTKTSPASPAWLLQTRLRQRPPIFPVALSGSCRRQLLQPFELKLADQNSFPLFPDQYNMHGTWENFRAKKNATANLPIVTYLQRLPARPALTCRPAHWRPVRAFRLAVRTA
jgi:hypothetical protein